MAKSKDYDRSCYCVTCQRKFLDKYAHAKKYPSHVISRHVAEKNVESETLNSNDTLDSRSNLEDAADEQIKQKSSKKVSGAEFASQPLFVAGLGTGLGWLSATAFGPDNALNQAEAYGIATGALRLVGRYFLKNVNLEELSEASDDIKDVLLIVRSVGDYIARKLQTRAQQQQAQMQQAGPTRAQPQPEPQPVRQQRAARNGHSEEEEAAFIQQQYAAAAMNMPYFGQEAA